MAQGDTIFYKIKQASLAPDEYGNHIIIKMISAYTGAGKFVKHIKLNEDTIKILTEGWVLPKKGEDG